VALQSLLPDALKDLNMKITGGQTLVIELPASGAWSAVGRHSRLRGFGGFEAIHLALAVYTFYTFLWVGRF
jgi:hypothetical protein